MVKQLLIAACLTIVCLVVGCAATPGLPTGYNVTIDSAFTRSEVTDIEEGITAWSSFGDSAPTFAFNITDQSHMPNEGDVAWTDVMVKKAPDRTITTVCNNGTPGEAACAHTQGPLEEIEDGAKSYYGPTGATIYMPPASYLSSNYATYVSVAAHEMGHAMGLHHTEAGTIMSPDADTSGPTCADFAYYLSLRPSLPKCARSGCAMKLCAQTSANPQ